MKLYPCLCCGRELQSYNYKPGAKVCDLCSRETVETAVIMTIRTLTRQHDMRADTRLGRRLAKREARMAQYAAQGGKWCAACHHIHPVGAYNACATRNDGLQPICRSCNKLTVDLARIPGGKAAWRATREALRATGIERPKLA